MTMDKTILLGLFLAMAASAPRAQAQDSFPANRVTIVVPSPAGSTTDALARLVAEQLSQSWGKPVIVENNSRGLNAGGEQAARAQPDGYTLLVSPPLPLTVAHLLFKEIGYQPDKMVHVPYRGAAPALNDLIAGHIDMFFDTLTTSVPLHQADKIRIMAVAGDERAPTLPDIPTITESGLPGFRSITWFALVGPPAMPAPLAARINRDVVDILQRPTVSAKLRDLRLDPMIGVQRASSSRTSRCACCGPDSAIGSKPEVASVRWNSASSITLRVACTSSPTIAGERPAGANSPLKFDATMPGSPASIAVGMSGAILSRVSCATARMRTLPVR